MAVTHGRLVPYGCPLTPRQLETLRLISDGLTYKEVALKRCCAVSTVRSHVHHICSRLNVAKCAQAVLIAYRKGWLDEHAENQTSVQVRRLAEATEELVVHLQGRNHKMPPALQHYLASFDDLMLARSTEERTSARDLMQQSLDRVLREKGIHRRTGRAHNEALAKLLDELVAENLNPTPSSPERIAQYFIARQSAARHVGANEILDAVREVNAAVHEIREEMNHLSEQLRRPEAPVVVPPGPRPRAQPRVRRSRSLGHPSSHPSS